MKKDQNLAATIPTRARARKVANLVPVNVTPEDTARIADAVSDEWEPLLREASALLRDNGYGVEVARFLLRMGALLDPADDHRFQVDSGS